MAGHTSYIALAMACYGAARALDRAPTPTLATYALLAAASICYVGIIVVTRRRDPASLFAFTGLGAARPNGTH